MEPRSFLPLAPRDYLILFTLVPEPLHGYGIVKRVEEGSEGSVLLDPANLYRALKRLMRDGLVAETDRRPADHADDERRRYYEITGLGRRVVELEAARLARLTDAARRRQLIPGREQA